jgi:hypothetical protein
VSSDDLSGDDFEIAFRVFEKPMKDETTSSSCAKEGAEVALFVNCVSTPLSALVRGLSWLRPGA